MNDLEAARLLTIASAFDRFVAVNDATVTAWQIALADIDYSAAQIAVVAHFKASSRPIMPADIRKAVLPARDPNSWMIRRGRPSWMLPPAEGWQDHHTEAAQ